MSKQCLSIEQMQHLKELGVDTSGASAYWHRVLRMNTNEVVTNWFVSFSEPSQCLATMKVETVPTFTWQDIWDLLPEATVFYKFSTPTCEVWYTGEDVWSNEHVTFEGKTLIDTAYEALLWCIENGIIETKKED